MIICFFVLLNALLAIIVDSYANVKKFSDQEADVDPISNMTKQWIHQITRDDLADSHIKNSDLARLLKDLYENVHADKNANQPGMFVLVQNSNRKRKTDYAHLISRRADDGKMANLISQNLDGTLRVRYADGLYANVPPANVRSARVKQARLPADVTDRILHADVESMKTLTRFYMMNKGTLDKPVPALIDQVSLILILKTIAPTMHIKLCLAISINILMRYGHNADLNGDGVVSPTEWEALEAVMDGLDLKSFNNPTGAAQKSRLVSLMLLQ